MKLLSLSLIFYFFLCFAQASDAVKVDASEGDCIHFDAQVLSVRIFCNTDNPNFFPYEWTSSKEINPKATFLSDKKSFLRAIKVIKKELLKYPKKILEENLQGIKLVKSMSFYGVTFGGTNSSKYIYLTIRSEEKGFSNDWIAHVLHAEFSSILLRKYQSKRLIKKKWSSHNPKSFSYLGSGVDAIKRSKSKKRGHDFYYQMGFLNEYSRSSFENDFNQIASLAMLKPSKMKSLASKYHHLKSKFDIWLSFMESISHEFNFEQLDKNINY